MATNDKPGPVMVELNLMHAKGLSGATATFKELYAEIAKHPVASLQSIANTYFRCYLSVNDVFSLRTWTSGENLPSGASTASGPISQSKP